MLVRVGHATDIADGKMRVSDVAGVTVNVAGAYGAHCAFDDTENV